MLDSRNVVCKVLNLSDCVFVFRMAVILNSYVTICKNQMSLECSVVQFILISDDIPFAYQKYLIYNNETKTSIVSVQFVKFDSCIINAKEVD